jgi:transcriptional regulator with XRE-family HTH domain
MNAIADIRKRLQLSQAGLASAINVNQSLISQYERGECQVSPKIARRLIDFAKSQGIEISFDSIYADVSSESSETAA